jgi:hypothetical protein
MSQENLDLFDRALAAMNGRDLDAFLAVMDDQVEAVPRIAAIDGAYRGPDGIGRWWNSLFGTFPDLAIDLAEVRDVDSLTIAAIRMHGSGVGSDVPIDETVWHVAWWREGKCTRWGLYSDEKAALEAAALPN